MLLQSAAPSHCAIRATARQGRTAERQIIVDSTPADKPSPAQARRNRLEKRLSATFTDAQVRCVLAKVKPATIVALDRQTAVAPGPALDDYSDATRACVANPTSTTTRTTTTTATTETAPTTATTTDATTATTATTGTTAATASTTTRP